MPEPRTVRQTVTLDVTYDVVTEAEIAADVDAWIDRVEEGHWLLIERPSGHHVVMRPYMVALDGPRGPVEDQTG
ncbi:hypothetical protein [Xylanimonas ulmi]|uniref:Uncharacterized protein n=1 Tax=Xylanimonas ulmi TaxID=228973 RepID=A0A4Q7M3G7_9MICO|nr:hypothetical protein [Xylanibacterium ulmi]RZS62465.1 hypothetical protein EV386_2798 [Xylanibacterium ulmi]